jgi:hypothetical protein
MEPKKGENGKLKTFFCCDIITGNSWGFEIGILTDGEKKVPNERN